MKNRKFYILAIVFFFLLVNFAKGQEQADTTRKMGLKPSLYLYGNTMHASEEKYDFKESRYGARVSLRHKKVPVLFLYSEVFWQDYYEENYRSFYTNYYDYRGWNVEYGVGLAICKKSKVGLGFQIEMIFPLSESRLLDSCLKVFWMDKNTKFFIGGGILDKLYTPGFHFLFYSGYNF